MVIGIQVDRPIQLDGGYEILPIEALPDSREKEQFLQSRFGYIVQPKPVPVSAIIYPCKVKKAINSDDLVSNEKDVEFWQSIHRLYEIALLLNALGGISCLPYYSTSYAYPTTPFGPFNGSGGGSSIYDVLGHNTAQLTPDSRTVIDALIKDYDKLPLMVFVMLRIIMAFLLYAER